MSTDYGDKEFRDHLEQEHKKTPLSEYLKEIVLGGIDGIITTFAIVAGFNGAHITNSMFEKSFFLVLLFGFANLFADGMSMGLGNFLSIKAAKDLYKSEKQKELHEIENNPEMEKKETELILKRKGFSDSDAKKMTALYAKNPKYWLDFMMNDELEMPNPEGDNAFLIGASTLLSFVLFGSLPILPYALYPSNENLFSIAIGSSVLALILLGLLRFKITKISLFRSLIEVLLLGVTAGSIAYIIGTFFQ